MVAERELTQAEMDAADLADGRKYRHAREGIKSGWPKFWKIVGPICVAGGLFLSNWIGSHTKTTPVIVAPHKSVIDSAALNGLYKWMAQEQVHIADLVVSVDNLTAEVKKQNDHSKLTDDMLRKTPTGKKIRKEYWLCCGDFVGYNKLSGVGGSP